MGVDPNFVSFTDRVAVVTGSGRGLGRAHALLLGKRGANVVVNDLPLEGGESSAAAVAEEIRADGGTAVACDLDLTTSGAAAKLIDSAMEAFGRVDIVINNAGVLRSVDFAEMTEETFDFVVGVNLRSSYFVCRAAWPIMIKQMYGRILSTTSNSGLLGTAGSTAYAAAKAGIWGMTRSLALEGEPHNINVNAIAPIAYTQMSMTSRIAPPAWQSGEGDKWADRLDPALVAPAAAWLVHEDCTINGEVLSVAGGRVARYVMGLSDGFDDASLTIENVRAHSDSLFHDDAPFTLHRRAADEGKTLRRQLLGGQVK
jgi:NAD(P)-dependent dehydrogenase (short-subunit alcohol dehydrogenase family)